MANIDRERWNERYSAGEHGTMPDEWLVSCSRMLKPSRPGARALDLACGAGRHALWLAELGYAVDAWDISDVGLDVLARELERLQASGMPVRVTPRQLDVETATIPPNAYDLILDAFFLDRRLFGQMIAALRSGGLLVVRTLMRRSAHEHRNPAYLLEPGELRMSFAALDILYDDEESDVGVAGIIARKTHL
jgi:tellurite methyltransferase